VSEIIAAPGTPVAVVIDGQISVDQNGKWKKITQ
jgi:hypothetical protein